MSSSGAAAASAAGADVDAARSERATAAPAASSSAAAAAQDAPAAASRKKKNKDGKKKQSDKQRAPAEEAPKPVVATLVGTKRKAPENDAVKSRLECAICMNIMFPPIRQCAEGHNFCDKCCSKLMNGTESSARKCPTCRCALEKPVARARNLEQWACEADVEVTCDHEECGQLFKYSEYAEHKKTCVGCSVSCPIAGCTWRGEAKDLGAHLMAAESDHGHLLPSCPKAAKFSKRHTDYSTTVIFETSRKLGNNRRWRPPRQLITVHPNSKLGTDGCTFVVALWKAAGAGEPLLAAISALRKPGHDETPWSFDISLSAYARPPRLCVSRSSASGPVGDLDARECWSRPRLNQCKAPVLVADAASMAIFNTAHLEDGGVASSSANGDENEKQRYELHVRLMPITADVDPRNGVGDNAEARLIHAGDRMQVHGDRLLVDTASDIDYSDAEGEEGEEGDSDISDLDGSDDTDDTEDSSDESDIDDDYSDSLTGSSEDDEH